MHEIRFSLAVPLLLAIFGVGCTVANVANMVCFYDAASLVRTGPAQMTLADLAPALQFCNYLVYGYAGVNAENYQLSPLNAHKPSYRDHYRGVVALKRSYPHLRVLLSVGGDKDLYGSDNGEPNKYLQLLEDSAHRAAFVNSAVDTLREFGFDGLDLAWQFPKNNPKVHNGFFKRAWSTVKGWFTGPKVIDEKAEEHKEQFTALVRELKGAFYQEAFTLSLTVLPHVNPELFLDIQSIVYNLDFINLATFDFHMPERDPKEADYPAPLYDLYERDPTNNVNYQVQYWLNNTTPARKINVGIPAYGRAWQMSKDSGITGYPPIAETCGSAVLGRETIEPGLVSWPEICVKLLTPANSELMGDDAPLRKVGDPSRRYGSYAYRASEEHDEIGIWVAYEDPDTAATKASYVNAKGLGGVALFDLSMDDFKGRCSGEKYTILRSIKYKL